MRKITAGLLMLLTPTMVSALTLPDSIDLALKNNPDVLVAQRKLDSAKAKLAQAQGAFLPTIKLDATLGKSYSQPSAIQIGTAEAITFGTDAVQDGQSWQASLTQPLFVAALFPGYQLARKYADLARSDLDKIIQDTSFNVSQAYFNVLKMKKMAEVGQEALDMSVSHQQKVFTMLSSGAATPAELLRADVQTANARVSLTKANNMLELAKNAFNNALGQDLQSSVDLSEEGFSGAMPALPDYNSLLNDALVNRQDWQQFVIAKQMSEENLKVAQFAYFPTAMLTASSGNQITEFPAYRFDVNSWAITGVASWTLFDGLGIQNRIQEAKANLAAQVAGEEQVKNGIKLEVRDAYLSLKSALETVDLTKVAVDSSVENFFVTDRRYNSGVGTNLEVLDAQVLLTQAKGNQAAAIYDLEIAKAKLNKVVGKEVL